MWDKTVICAHIRDFLGDAGHSTDEYSLICYLDSQQCFGGFPAAPPSLQLFRKHFITRHCLYSLQTMLSPDWCLEIGLLNISLCRAEPASSASQQLGGSDAALREYYLNLTHLDEADVATVETLLKSFWQRFAATTGSAEAYAVLELNDTATWTEIQMAYRRKVQRAHPDQGGTATEFAVVQNAYDILKRRFGKSAK